METARLEGALLDYFVLKAEGYQPRTGTMLWVKDGMPVVELAQWQPSINWAQGGPIVQREGIELFRLPGIRGDGSVGLVWYGSRDLKQPGADTPLVAAMRAYLLAKFGEQPPE